ncbi:MAG: hypothetical protein K6T85_09205, partial [Gorillibacterium sp.]|nr:hypothetical protein [Gorillibacterium sp.]
MTDIQKQSEHQSFKEPASAYRPAPLWIWNEDIRTEVIREQLQELAAGGFGGAFVHPRPGLVTEYLSEQWFGLWQDALDEAERLGLKLYIYDENSYPSGFAGGHVPSELPDCLANSVHFKEYLQADLAGLSHLSSPMLNRPGHPIRAFAIRATDQGSWEVVQDITMLPVAQWPTLGERFWVYELGTPETNNWLGGFAYTDLMRPEVTELFLKTTHEQYRSRFGDRFGKTIPALFTDEPEISPGNLFQDGDSFLPFSYWFAAEFEKRNGYSLFDYLPFLFRDAIHAALPKDARQVRYDFYSTIHQLWTVNSVQPISEWCERNGLAFTGHYLEHNWPHPFNRSSPSVMSMQEYMHWPGVDVLTARMLRVEYATAEGYNEKSTQLLIGIHEAQSAANQFDRERVLCEAFGAGGWDSSFEDYKRTGDWLFVHGINFLNPHLTYYTITGSRKRDHPQSFDWRQPWWEEFKTLNAYFSRLSFLLSQGKTRNRILMLNPTTSSYMFAPSDLLDNRGYLHGVEQTRELAQRLSDSSWDYDWGDEFILERHGRMENGQLTVGKRSYTIVIVPPAMLGMRSPTVELLRRYMEQGGTVLSWDGEGLQRKDGMLWNPKELTGQDSWVSVDHFNVLDAELRKHLTPRVEWGSGTMERHRIAYLHRELEDGSTLFFFVNSTPEDIEDVLHVKGGCGEIWDPVQGTVNPLSGAAANGRLDIPVQLKASGSLLLRIYASQAAADTNLLSSIVDNAQLGSRKVLLSGGDCAVMAEKGNLLPILYCDLTVGTKIYKGVYTAQANRMAFEHHGFSMNPWDNGVQFKRRYLERNETFDERTGITVDYRFWVRPGEVPSSIGVIVERPELYRIRVNGIPICVEPGTCWLDHRMGEASIQAAIREGDNVITLAGKPFSIFMEIEPVFVTGDFAIEEVDQQWVIGSRRPLGVGSWREQGYPFYGSAMSYSKTVWMDSAISRARLILPDWAGTVAAITVNGVTAGLIGLDRCNELDLTPYIAPDANNLIDVRVSGNFKNMLGPHFDPAKPRKVAWPHYWKQSPLVGPPPAADYDLIDYG